MSRAFVLVLDSLGVGALPDAGPGDEGAHTLDHLVASNGYNDDGLEGVSGFYSAYNIGFIFIRANALEFVQARRTTSLIWRAHHLPDMASSSCRRGATRRGGARTTGTR